MSVATRDWSGHPVRFCCEQSARVGCPLLSRSFNGGLWLRRQLKNRRLLPLAQARQEYDLTVRKFERIVMRRYFFLVDLPKDRRLVTDYSFVPAQ